MSERDQVLQGVFINTTAGQELTNGSQFQGFYVNIKNVFVKG